MNEIAEHLVDVFRLFGTVEVRRMFGGYGVYRDGLMFALVADDTLYLKSDARSGAAGGGGQAQAVAQATAVSRRPPPM